VGSSLGGGATAAKAEGRVGASQWRGEAMGLSLGGGATAGVESHIESTPRDSVARRIISIRQWVILTGDLKRRCVGAPSPLN